MNKNIVLLIIIIVSIIISIPFSLERRKRLSKYWSRLDFLSAKKWKKRFPNSSKNEIREFLENFVDGFAFKSNKRLKFEPEDKVQDIYNALYPKHFLGLEADSMEFETFYSIIEKEYKIAPETFWKEDITAVS